MEHTYPKLVRIWLSMITTDQIQSVKRGKPKAPKVLSPFFREKASRGIFPRNVLFLLRNFFNSPIQLLMTLVVVFYLLLQDLDFHFTFNPHKHIQHKSHTSGKPFSFYKCYSNPSLGPDKGIIEVTVKVITGGSNSLFVKGVSDSW